MSADTSNNVKAPTVFVGAEVRTVHFADLNSALDAAVAAERLTLGWRLDAYDCPIGDDVTQREWRLVVWRDATADSGPLATLRDET